ncbi:hypothetical protein [Alcaligenes endophyticus]|uniref:Uncharacterized protein n=1 Tax=Alcaligenes endophyticus TaxID=1929088 RepID=A0ABT8EMD5_9BURK|nr:hypothetical protein [Alcaligenes endophyticus]MCX5590959.1 hypothetical protein [Alcaligenes endophyticus]MDN4122464.1 hypothetical protein [Alcaligenes endophyticus]
MDSQMVRNLARIAALNLAPGREELISPTLRAWYEAANELNQKMSAAPHQNLQPITVFQQEHEQEES